MGSRQQRWQAGLCLAVALMAGAASALGVFARGEGAAATAVSIRGERFEYVTSGIYAYNAVRVVAEGVGWDYVTLLLVVPSLLLVLPLVARGSLRGQLFAVGLLSYLFYQYLQYALFWAFGPLFPLFVVLYPLSLVAIVWIVSSLDIASLPSRFGERFPRRGMAIFSGLMALLLVAMWSGRIAAGLRGDFVQAALFGTPTMVVQALDLGIIVPLAIATATLVWRSRPFGYLLATVFAIKGVAMAAAICAMLLSAWAVEGKLEVGPFAIFGAATLASAVLAWKMFASVKPSAAGT